MDMLGILLSSQVKAEIVRLLFVSRAERIHMRELARRSGCSFSAVQRETIKLKSLGVVSEEKDGNRTYVFANKNHPYFPELLSLVRKSNGVAEMLREAIGDSGIEIAFIFGSIANATENPRSDIDLMIIGNLGLRELIKRMKGLTERIGREINPHVVAPIEFSERLKRSDHFITTVMKQPKQFLIGDEIELKRLAK
jgi:predicted nucleotidyltransferase